MKTKTLPVALVQERNHCDAAANLAVIEQRVGEAAKQGAKLVLLQELHNGPYFCQHESVSEFDLAETIPGPITERLAKLAKQHGLVLVSSLFERRAAGSSKATLNQGRDFLSHVTRLFWERRTGSIRIHETHGVVARNSPTQARLLARAPFPPRTACP